MSSLNSGTHLPIHIVYSLPIHTAFCYLNLLPCLPTLYFSCSDFSDSILLPLPTAKTWSFVCFRPFCTQNPCLIQAFLHLIFSVWSILPCSSSCHGWSHLIIQVSFQISFPHRVLLQSTSLKRSPSCITLLHYHRTGFTCCTAHLALQNVFCHLPPRLI